MAGAILAELAQMETKAFPQLRTAQQRRWMEITDKELLVYNFILDFYVLCDTASCPSTSRYVLSCNL